MSKEVKRRTMQGRVVSDKMDKTIVVATRLTYEHPQFGKVLRKTKNYKVHDEEQVAKVGDVVEFYETAPIAKTKYMRLARVVSKAQAKA